MKPIRRDSDHLYFDDGSVLSRWTSENCTRIDYIYSEKTCDVITHYKNGCVFKTAEMFFLDNGKDIHKIHVFSDCNGNLITRVIETNMTKAQIRKNIAYYKSEVDKQWKKEDDCFLPNPNDFLYRLIIDGVNYGMNNHISELIDKVNQLKEPYKIANVYCGDELIWYKEYNNR